MRMPTLSHYARGTKILETEKPSLFIVQLAFIITSRIGGHHSLESTSGRSILNGSLENS